MISWIARLEPLAIAGVLARGDAARSLARRIVERPEAARQLSGVSFRDGIVVVGNADAIPWVDGVTWLGREPSAPALYLPTDRAVTPHPALVLAALRARAGEAPIVLVPEGDRVVVISLAMARVPGGPELEAWCT